MIIIGEEVKMPTRYGNFNLIPFQEKESGIEHIVLVKGEWDKSEAVLTRMHSSCATGNIFGSLRCDCGEQLVRSMELIEAEGRGIIVYLEQEGRGIGLMSKMKAYKLQEEGMDTVDANLFLGFAADERDYKIGAKILRMLKAEKIRLLTNNPAKIKGLEKYGIKVEERVPLVINSNSYNDFYLETKNKRMAHLGRVVNGS